MINNMKKAVMVLAIALGLGAMQPAAAGVSFSVGTDDFYLSVGNYDYLPYAYRTYPQFAPSRINFYDVMSDYGNWVSVSTFGRAWRPYADYGWRPYVHGHWVNTRYGMTWQGYEPWAWAGYHYGNWIWTRDFGWVWIPGYEWHPGRVAWSHGYGSIGWMPAPPYGYDYSRGYLSYRGSRNQFTYNDPDFYDYDDEYYGDSYYDSGYDSGYRDLYNNPGYSNINVNLWVFIDNNHFGYDNYADYYLDRDYTQNVFQRRLVRISSKPLQREQVQRIIKQNVREIQVEEKELQTDKQKIKVVIPVGEEENIRKHANKTVREVIAPAFAQKHKTFKGTQAKNEQAISKVFHQENKPPKVQTVDSDEVVRKAQQTHKERQVKREQITKQEVEHVKKIEQEVKKRPQPKARQAEEQRTHESEKKQQPGTITKQERDQQFEQKNQPKPTVEQEKSREREQQKLKDAEQQKQRELQNQKQREFDQKKQHELQNQKQLENEQQKQREINQKRELDQQKQREIQQQKQREFDQKKQRDLQSPPASEQEKEREIDQRKKPEQDEQKQRELEQQKEQELRKEPEKVKESETEKQKQQEIEKAKQKAKQKEKDKKKPPEQKPDDDGDKQNRRHRS